MRALVVVGTTREGRKTIGPARTLEAELERQGHEAVFFDLRDQDIPFLGNRRYVEGEEPVPDDVEKFGREVEDADIVFLVSPEYNHSIPGALKNALDYLYPEYDGKPFGYVTVSAGGFGGLRALDHLQDITLGLNAHPGPSLQVSRVGDRFEDGEPDEETVERFESFVTQSEKFAGRMS